MFSRKKGATGEVAALATLILIIIGLWILVGVCLGIGYHLAGYITG
jgi:hypothetical protein